MDSIALKERRPLSMQGSGIRDNHRRGAVADFLKAKVQSGSRLSVVSAYFTIYAYDEGELPQASRKLRSLEREIDGLVYALYGLTPAEIKIVEESASR